MSVMEHPTLKGCQRIKLWNRELKKNEYITFEGSRDDALIYEQEIRGITDRSDPLFGDKLPQFRVSYANEVQASTFKDFGWAFKQVEPYFSPYKLRNITPHLVEMYKAHRLGQGVKKRTVTRELSYLGKYLAFCGVALRPKGFRKKDCQPPPIQVMSLDEMTRVIGLMRVPQRYIVQLMAYNGLRREEALSLRSENASIDGTSVKVCGKGEKWRNVTVELPEVQKAIAKAKDARPNGYLFPNPRTDKPFHDLRIGLAAAGKRAGVDQHVHNHLLRHSFATALIRADEDVTVVQKALGHADIATTQKYIHLADASVRKAAGVIAKMVADSKG